ncbi:hypothetical protein STRDD11_00022 [Streptococcus sp. DD11]|nr:hypothetical protein STRDD11_00022 [Streptococcus sp. DD11]
MQSFRLSYLRHLTVLRAGEGGEVTKDTLNDGNSECEKDFPMLPNFFVGQTGAFLLGSFPFDYSIKKFCLGNF